MSTKPGIDSTEIMQPINSKGSLNVYYHFYYPDDVVSAELFKDLCEGLAARGWQVTVFTSNRYCRKAGQISPSVENINAVNVKRSWRPAFRQASNIGRLANGFFISLGWVINTLISKKPDFYIFGTDPQFSQFLFPVLKLISPKTKIIHWCHDLYPEAVIANTNNPVLIRFCQFSKPAFKFLYKFVDVMVDIGICMQKRLQQYQHKAKQITLTPWALTEPQATLEVKPDKRQALFGNAKLVLLYSGNLGHAHQYQLFLKLARLVRSKNPDIIFAFSSSGNKFEEFKSQITENDSNIKLLPFAAIGELEDRLCCADIHLISLKDQWSGIVVPSKFFGSLAVGRPLLFHGPKDSAIGYWIEKFNIGASLTEHNLDKIANDLIRFAEAPQLLEQWKQNAFNAYTNNFSKKIIIDKWDELLMLTLAQHEK